MAYVDQDLKKKLAKSVNARLEKVLKGDHLKVTFSVRNHSTIVATINSGSIDFGKEYAQVNHYWIQDHYEGRAKEVLMAIKDGLMSEHWDRSDSSVDYFDCSYYISINIGKWNKPYRKA